MLCRLAAFSLHPLPAANVVCLALCHPPTHPPPLQDVPSRIFPVLDYFSSIGMDTAAQRRLLVKAPTILAYSLERVKVGGVGGWVA